MDPTPLLPFLMGLIPIVLARTWQARIVAILYGVVSIGLGVYLIWIIQHGPDDWTGIQMIARPVVGALCVSLVSSLVTFHVDKKYKTKA